MFARRIAVISFSAFVVAASGTAFAGSAKDYSGFHLQGSYTLQNRSQDGVLIEPPTGDLKISGTASTPKHGTSNKKSGRGPTSLDRNGNFSLSLDSETSDQGSSEPTESSQ